MEDNNKEPFLLSPCQMYQIEKLTKQLEEIRETIRARNNFCNKILHAFGNPYPIEETHEKVYHVSGFRPLRMCKILFGEGLRWVRHKGIYYNTTEFACNQLSLVGYARGVKARRRHISEAITEDFFYTHNRLVHWIGVDWFRVPTFGYLRRFGHVPLVVTYEIYTVGFNEDAEVYKDPEYTYPPIDDNGEEYSIFRYVQQDCIPSPFIRLKAITLALPMFKIYKVLWRRK